MAQNDPAGDRGAPIAYTVLAEGTPVVTADGEEIGTVTAVRADETKDIFDGLVVRTHHHRDERFVDAPEVADIYERLVVTTLTADQAKNLPKPDPGPAIIDVDAGTVAGEEPPGPARRAWDRLTGAD